MKKRLKQAAFGLSLIASTGFVAFPAYAEGEFSAGSNAKEFGFQEEEKATFSGKVVDILCELAGDCRDDCGAGHRHLGIVREADNQLIFVLKNSQFSFNGAVEDLLPYCNQNVDVDGVLVADPEDYGAKFYMVQFIREAGAAEWSKTNLWVNNWKKKNPDVAEGKGPWFSRDPRVIKQLEATGRLGLGHDADDAYRETLQ